MSVEHRVNPKTKEDQYRVRYRWRNEEGRLCGSKTGWFPSIAKAQKNADQLKAAKEADSALKITNKREAYIKTVFKDMYVKELDEKYQNTSLDTTTKPYNLWRRAFTIEKYYIPEEVRYTKINEITPRTFRIWADHINNTKLAGATVHRYIECLFHFNRWLADKGYYTDSSLEMSIDTMLCRFNTKDKKIGARKDRYLLGMDDIEKITGYWKAKGLGTFFNFYHYTLWYALAYTGTRPEEMRALQWKFVDLSPEHRVIHIENAIPDQEKEAKAIERTDKGIYFTKTPQSVRGIPIFDFIYALLKDYRQSYKYEFKLEEEEMGDCFVFPHLNHDHTFDPHMFAGRGRWLVYLKKTIKAVGIPNTDIGMIRHATATFLVAPEPDGLGFSEEQVMAFFGHLTTQQLQITYAKLEAQQKTKRLKKVFKGYYNPDEDKEETKKNAAKERMLQRIGGDNEQETHDARRDRIWLQIVQAILQGRPYYYNDDDEEIINELRPKLANYNIELKKESK